jgi:prophage regulatory protein
MQKVIRLPQVKNVTGLSRSTIYAYMKEEKFPQSISLGSRAVGWTETSIESWIQKQIKISENK